MDRHSADSSNDHPTMVSEGDVKLYHILGFTDRKIELWTGPKLTIYRHEAPEAFDAFCTQFLGPNKGNKRYMQVSGSDFKLTDPFFFKASLDAEMELVTL